MAPQTRSGGRAAATTSDRVYKSSKPAKQAKFPHRKTEVRTYSSRKPTARVISHRQQKTLTQMYEITRSSPLRVDLSDEEEEPAPKKRRTTGDEQLPSSSFHTQTLTQMSRRPSEKSPDEEDDVWQFQASDDEAEPPVLPSANDKENQAPGKKPPSGLSSVPQTPTNKRTVLEIPSSQGSPLTPMLARYSPAPNRSPLKSKSTNTTTPIKLTGSLKRPRTLTIQDSYATIGSQSPSQRSSPSRPPLQPAKNVRFITPHPTASLSRVEEEIREDPVERGLSVSPSPRRSSRPPLGEIADSEDESDLDVLDEEAEGYDAVGEETQLQMDQLLTSSENQALKEASAVEEGDSDKENVTPAASEEEEEWEEEATVVMSKPFVLPKLARLNSGSSGRRETVEVITSSPDPTRNSDSSISEATEETLEESISETPRQSQKTPKSKRKGSASTPKTPHTQGLESQRLSLDVIRGMAPQTDRSDIFISIHPEHVENIVAGTKNHEFRAYKIPSTVSRMWLYITRPVSQLKYMACISDAKAPGEIDNDGIGNSEFNQHKKTTAKFAYQLYEIYELNDPVGLPDMIENGWVNGPPQRYNYVPPAVVGHLMANLRCSVFGEEEQDENKALEEDSISEVGRKEASQTSLGRTVSQELADQIRSDMAHSTHDTSEADILVPSSQTPTRNRRVFGTELFPKPALPPTPFSRPSNSTRRAIRPSQATTVSQASSPSQSPIRAVPKPTSGISSLPIFVDDDNDSPIRLPPGTFQLNSSQLLSTSQMLPESLLREDEEDIVYDSDQDNEEL